MKLNTNNIYCGDCEELIPKLQDNSVDIIVTSPPYNVDLGNNKYNKNGYIDYQDNKSYKIYIEWLEGLFHALKPKLVEGGRVCINIGDGKNGKISTHSNIIQFMTNKLKYLITTTIIWEKSQIGNRTAWGSFKSPSNPSFPTPFEYILVFCKNTYKKIGEKENITVSSEEFIKNSLAIWKFAPEKNMNTKFKHPAMFPVELPRRLIQQLSYKNDVVLDIFSGLGTTCLAAAQLERKWIGFEQSKKYAEDSIKRIMNYTDQNKLY